MQCDSLLVTPTKTMEVVTRAVAASRILWPACSLSKVPPTAVLLKSSRPSPAVVSMADAGAAGFCGVLSVSACQESMIMMSSVACVHKQSPKLGWHQ